MRFTPRIFCLPRRLGSAGEGTGCLGRRLVVGLRVGRGQQPGDGRGSRRNDAGRVGDDASRLETNGRLTLCTGTVRQKCTIGKRGGPSLQKGSRTNCFNAKVPGTRCRTIPHVTVPGNGTGTMYTHWGTWYRYGTRYHVTTLQLKIQNSCHQYRVPGTVYPVPVQLLPTRSEGW